MWVLPTFWVVEWRQQILGSARFGILVLLLATWIFFQARRALCSEKGGSPGNVAVFISYCCCNESYPQIPQIVAKNKTKQTQHCCIIFCSGDRKSRMDFTRLKSKCQRGCVPSGSSRRRAHFPVFSSIQTLLTCLGLQSLPPSAKPALHHL